MLRRRRLDRDRLEAIVELVYRGNQRQAAAHFQMAPPTLNRIMSGERKNPRLHQVTLIASALGITVDSLLVNGEG